MASTPLGSHDVGSPVGSLAGSPAEPHASIAGSRFDVLVVGGGPVGLTLSIALSNLGVRHAVVERDAAPHPLPRAILMDAETRRSLNQLGLGPQLDPLLTPITSAEYVDVHGSRLAGDDLVGKPMHGGLPRSCAHYQPELDALLEAECVARGATLWRGVRCVGVTSADDGVDVTLDDGRVLNARYVVGCDGASSTVRRALGVGWTDQGFDQDWLVVDVELRDPVGLGLTTGAQQVCDPARPTTLVAGHGRMFRWEFQLQPGEDPAVMQQPEQVWSLLDRWIRRDDGKLVRAASYRFHAVVATSMREGRVLLAGDAAHQMPPFMGQGLNSGMRDAVNLAWKLRWVLAGWAGAALLDSYSAERLEHVTSVVHQSIDAGRLIDQFAGRESHGLTPGAGYGSDRGRPRYRQGVVAGDHPRVGTPFMEWHAVASSVPVGPEMVVVSSTSSPPSVSGLPGRWAVEHLDRAALYGADHVVVRPDGYVAAVCSDADLRSTLDDLVGRLHA